MAVLRNLLLFFALVLGYTVVTGEAPLNKIKQVVAGEFKNNPDQTKKQHEVENEPLAYALTDNCKTLVKVSSKGKNEKPFKLGFEAKILAFTDNGKSLYLANTENRKMVKVVLDHDKTLSVVSPEGVPNALVLSPSGERGFASYDTGEIYTLNFKDNTYDLVTTFVDTPDLLLLDADDNKLFLTLKNCTEVLALNLDTCTHETVATLETAPEAITFSVDKQKIYVVQKEILELVCLDLKSKSVETLFTDSLLKKYLSVSNHKTQTIQIKAKETKMFLIKEKGEEIVSLDLNELETSEIVTLDQPLDSALFFPEPDLKAAFTVEETFTHALTLFDATKTETIRKGRISYEWDFGDGLSAISEEPTIHHSYDVSGEYEASLKATQIVETFSSDEELSGFAKLVSIAKESIGIFPRDKKTPVTISKMAASPFGGTAYSTTVGTPSQTTIIFGQSVTDSAVVTGDSINGIPTGTVTFFVGATQIGSPVTLVAGPGFTATATSGSYTPTAVGTYQWTAQYNGDTVYDISQDASPTNAFAVTKATSLTNLLTSVNPSVFGQSVTLTANVTLNTSNAIPTGTVTFFDGATSLGTSNLVSGTATLAVSNLSVATHSLTAVYNGDTDFATSTSNTVSQTVNKANSTTALTSSVNPTFFGQSTILSANVTTPTGLASGTVTFKDGAATIATVTLAGGSATTSVANLSQGTHSLTVVYSGDGNFNTSTSPAVSQVVKYGTTTSTLTSSVNPTTYGQQTTFTATVAVNQGVGTPTGFFTFMDGLTTLGTINLTGLSASFPISTLSVSVGHSITAIYSGDVNFSTSTSPVVSQVVNKATPTITLVSNVNPSNYADQVIFTSTVTSPTTLGLPSGTVSFYDGAMLMGTGALIGTSANTATTSFQLNTLSGGNHTITAVYNSDTNFTAVTSTPVVQNVILANTTTSIFSITTNPSEIGQPVILKANVVGSVSNPPLSPSGTVTFFDGATPIGTAPLTMLSSNAGNATLTISNFTLGAHSLTAHYSSDVNYNASTSTPMVQNVTTTTTANTIVTSHTPSVFGETVNFISTISSNIPGGGSPTGFVQFYNGTMSLGTAPLVPLGPNTSTATLPYSALSLGSHQINSTYLGDGNYTSSTSTRIMQLVIKDATTTVITSSLNPSNFGDNVTFSATVTANAPGSGIPTGIVGFYNGATFLGNGTINGAGVATYSTIALYPGTYPAINAKYVGDTNFIASNSANYQQVVVNKLNTVTTITSSRNSSPQGDAVTYTANVTAITGTPTGQVEFFDNGVSLGFGTLVNGFATLTEPGTGLTTLGFHPITATYVGDANFITSTSTVSPLYPQKLQYVVPYRTALNLAITTTPYPSTSPEHVEQANAVLTAQLTALPSPHPGFSTTGGTVTFYDGTNAISGPIAVPDSGTVTFMPNNLQFGSRTFTAVYSGDETVFAMATSNAVTERVQQTDMLVTTTVLSASPQATAYSCQSITLTANVSVPTGLGFYTPTGVVSFFDGNKEIGSALLNNSGIANLSVSTLSVGVHTLRATYNSDSNYAFSSSSTIQQTIVANPTTTTLSLIPNLASTPYGQELSFVATVTSPFGIPKGTVTFTDENGELDTISLDSTGMATYITTETVTGPHTYTASYDPNCCALPNVCFVASSATLVHTVTPISPKLTLSALPSPATYGDLITLYANVAAYQNGNPSGSVTFYNGTTVIGTSPIVQGLATIDVPNIQAGLTLFRARYNGDTNFIPANFPSFLEVVNKVAVPVSLTSLAANPSRYGETVTFTSSVVSSISIPTGSIKYFLGTTLLATMPLNANGQSSLNVSTLALGANTLSAQYSGDSNFLAATSANYVQNVIKADTSVTITSSTPSPSTFNTPVTFNVAVTPLAPGSGIPSGTVQGFLGSTLLGTATLSNGVGSFVTTVLPVGTQPLTVVYAGDTNFNDSKGSGTQTVNPAATSVSSLTSSVNSSVFGQSVTLSTKISSTAGNPSGTVSFLDGTTEIGVATLDTNGNATLTKTNFTVATHPIKVRYNATGNYASTPITPTLTLNQVVNKANTTTTLTSTIPNAVYGQSVTFTANVIPTSPGAGMPTGTVTFKNGAVTLGTVPLGTSGLASFSTSTLAASLTSYSITAVYSSDTNFNASTSAVLSQMVSPVSTITSVVSSINPSALGQLISLDVTVNAVNTGLVIPNGTVTASYGSTILGTGSLDPNGKISFLTSSLPAGTLPIIITYAGNSNFSPSSTTLAQTVTKGTTTTTLVSSLNPSHVGESLTLTATVIGSSGTPNGTVSFFDGSTLIGTQTLAGTTASLTTSSLVLGAHNIRAIFSGDNSYAGSTSAVLVQNVIQATTSVAVTSSVNPTEFGQQTIFTANVAVVLGSGTPTGTITFKEGTNTIGTGSVSGGVATLAYSTLPLGTHAITAVYNGDVNYAVSTSPALSQVVQVAVTNTTLSSTPNPSLFGNVVLLTATVNVPVGAGTPTGTIIFRDGLTVIGTGTLSAGQTTLSVSNLTVGTHPLTAEFIVSGNYAGSTSSPLNQVVNPATVTATLASNINPSMFGQPVILTATISVMGPTPATGNVLIKDGSITIATVPLVNGVATTTISTLSVNIHLLTAVYAGDSNYSGATSAILTQVVNDVATTTNLVSSLNPSQSGNSVTFTATVSPQVGSNIPIGTVNFYQGTTFLSSATLVGGVANASSSGLPVGTNSITAVYLGASDFLTSTSAPLVQIVNSGSTATTLTSSANPSTFGQPVTFTANVAVTGGTGTPTGSVTFLDGSTVIGTGRLTVLGQATLVVDDLDVSAGHPVTAVYSGDINFSSSTSSVLNQVVNKAASITNILASSPNPSMLGQTVTLFATVTTPIDTSPTGTITFYDGATAIGTVPVYNGLAVLSTIFGTVGNHTINANYSGDVNYTPSSTATTLPIIQVVNPTSITTTTVTTLTSSLNPSQVGQMVTFNVTVAPIFGGGTPTGIVTIFAGSNPLATLSLVNGAASYQTDALSAGTFTIVALYSGDALYSSSTSALAQVVQPISTTTTVVSSINPSSSFQAVTFTATITSAGPTPTGSVSFYDGAAFLGTTNVNNIGQASLTTSSLTTAIHTINVFYNPDTNFTASSTNIVQTVNDATTVTDIITSTPNPSNVGENVAFIASVSSAFGTPTGTVNFYEGATLIGSGTLFNGLTIFNTSTLSPGTHLISAVYQGAPNYAASQSLPTSQVVLPAAFATTTVLNSSLNPAPVGVPVTFSATVTSLSGIPTGTVSFYDGSTSLGTSLIVGGSAQLTTSTLSLGSHSITAIYNGDINFNPSSSAPYIQVIGQSTVPNLPQNFYGCQVINKYLNHDEIVNILTWNPPQDNASIVGYEIYRDAGLTELVGKVDNQCPHSIEDGNRLKKVTYEYYLVSVNAAGIKSPAVHTTVMPHKKPKKRRFELMEAVCDVLGIEEEAASAPSLLTSELDNE